MTDQQLVKKIRNGDDAAFEQLFRAYFKLLTVYAASFLKDLDVAQDLTQDVFVRLYERKSSLEIHSSLKSFLYTTVRNKCLDYIKINRIHNDHKEVIKKQFAGAEIEHSDRVMQVELQQQIYNAIDALPEQRQKIFKLSRLNGKSNQEIASELDLSKRTVETHISNALKNLKEQLSGYINLVIIIITKFFM